MSTKNTSTALNSFTLKDRQYKFFDIAKANFEHKKLPFTLRVLLENTLRLASGNLSEASLLAGFADWIKAKGVTLHEVNFMVARVLMQDFTGVPAIVDLAAMRDQIKRLGCDPASINPLIPVDLVIDHSLQVVNYATSAAAQQNIELEMQNNYERYKFLRWGASAFDNFRLVPPGKGICHQVNIEYLAQVVCAKGDLVYFETLLGTDSHTTMVNALGVLGWGVGGIEAEAAMLGQPMRMIIPQVVGVRLEGSLEDRANATDLVLSLTQMLRAQNVVGKFVEFYGPAMRSLSLADRATIANMAPEYGATCGFFPIDEETIKYLTLTNRSFEQIELIEFYAKLQGLWHEPNHSAVYSQNISFDLASVRSSVSGPKRPQDRMDLNQVKDNFLQTFSVNTNSSGMALGHGSVVIAAITSCTNTSNPYAMIGAGLMAKKICQLKASSAKWVKTSFAPGSQVVSYYLKAAGLTKYLDQLGFNIVGYGCTTCIGNSGALEPDLENLITQNNLQVAAVLSGNRNFEGRIHPLVKANYLASPMLVMAYAIAGTVNIDIQSQPLCKNADGVEVYLDDIWPTKDQINQYIEQFVSGEFFAQKYADIFQGSKQWQNIEFEKSQTYNWTNNSYIQSPPYFTDLGGQKKQIINARILASFGDSITTDHISPAGNIAQDSPAGSYLLSQGVEQKDFNSYGGRRGNHEVMMRGTFANIRLKNELCQALPPEKGALAISPDGAHKKIYDAAMEFKAQGVPLVIFAGKEYGTGSSRDWAAKGVSLLGIRAVIAESFERIHRSNLVGMGVLPLCFLPGNSRKDLNLKGEEVIDILFETLSPKCTVECVVKCIINGQKSINLQLQVFTDEELQYLKYGSILHKIIHDHQAPKA